MISLVALPAAYRSVLLSPINFPHTRTMRWNIFNLCCVQVLFDPINLFWATEPHSCQILPSLPHPLGNDGCACNKASGWFCIQNFQLLCIWKLNRRNWILLFASYITLGGPSRVMYYSWMQRYILRAVFEVCDKPVSNTVSRFCRAGNDNEQAREDH